MRIPDYKSPQEFGINVYELHNAAQSKLVELGFHESEVKACADGSAFGYSVSASGSLDKKDSNEKQQTAATASESLIAEYRVRAIQRIDRVYTQQSTSTPRSSSISKTNALSS